MAMQSLNGILPLQAYLQPIVSAKQRAIVGVEALIRGISADTHEVIMPQELFARAQAHGEMLAMDRVCRTTACREFSRWHRAQQDLLLFLNFDVAVIDQGVVGSNFLIDQALSFDLSPRSVVIEIIESRVRDQEALQRFVDIYRDYGFLIALDDVGCGHSNLDRVPAIKPDILKIDRALVANIHREYYKQVVFRSLVHLAENIGALVVAEGIEQEEEAITVLEMGADLLQGFYFSPPRPADRDEMAGVRERTGYIAEQYRHTMIDQVRRLKARHAYYDQLIQQIAGRLALVGEADFDTALGQVIRRFPALECLYVLDLHGIQLSDTVCNPRSLRRQAHPVFRPAKRGADHSLKEYFYLTVNTSIEKYTTEPYISLASGNRCVTIAKRFHDAGGKDRVLCVDVAPE